LRTCTCRFGRVAALLSAVVLAAASAEGVVDISNIDQCYGKYRDDISTPHIAWAKPLAGGPIKTLLVSSFWSCREGIELGQRLDMTTFPVQTYSPENLLVGPRSGNWREMEVPHEKALAVMRPMFDKPFDVALIGQFRWEALEKDMRRKILDRVRAGAGLVLVYHEIPVEINAALKQTADDDRERGYIVSGVPLDLLPVFCDYEPEELIRTGLLGKGRFVWLNQRLEDGRRAEANCLTPSKVCERAPYAYDYCLALVARAMLWAARRQGEIRIAAVEVPVQAIPRRALASQRVTVKLSGPVSAAKGAQVVFAFHDGEDVTRAARRSEVKLARGADKASFTLPRVRAGLHFVDAWVRDSRGILDWASVPVRVVTDARVASVSPERESFAEGEPVGGTLWLAGPREELRLRVELWDNYDGVLARREFAGDGIASDQVRFSLPMPWSPSPLLRLRASLWDDKGEVHRAETEIGVRLRDLPDFMYAMWASGLTGDTRFDQLVMRQMRRMGVNTAMTGGWGWTPKKSARVARAFARANLLMIPYVTHLGTGGNEKRWREPCLTNPETFERQERAVSPVLPSFAKYTVPAVSIGDEIWQDAKRRDLCFSPTCQAHFRQWLREKYGDLSRLNSVWGTSFKQWDDVSPITANEAADKNQIPRWVDHRLHMQRVFIDGQAQVRDIVRRYAPGARVGSTSDGYLDSYFSVNDWHYYCRKMDYLCTTRQGTEAISSWAPHDSLAQRVFGGYEGETYDTQHVISWTMLLRGMNGVFYWPVRSSRGLGGPAALAPDLVPFPRFVAGLGETNFFNRGAARLLQNEGLDWDPIYIHYSPRSLHVGAHSFKENFWEFSLRSFEALTEDSGFRCRYMDTSEVARGDLIDREAQVLIMPYSQAVTAKEAEEIRRFVSEGGLLLADFVPGKFDGFGRKLPRGCLADVVGDKQPAEVVVRAFGKGRACLFGEAVKGYKRGQEGAKPETARRLFARALAEAKGLHPRCSIVDRVSGDLLPGVLLARFGRGEAKYVGMIRPFDRGEMPPANVRIRLPRKSYVYDMRQGKYLGFTDTIDTVLERARGKLYSLLPYRLSRLQIDLSGSASPGEAVPCRIRVRPDAGLPVRHVVHIEVADPTGTVLPRYTRNVTVGGGRAATNIRLAFNELPGGYRILCRDAATGVTAEAKLNVK